MKKLNSVKEAFDTSAEMYQDKFMDQSRYQVSIDLFSSYIKPTQSKVLELGVGPGNITQYILSKHPNLEFLCTDIAPAMLKLAEQNNPTIRILVLDAREIDVIKEKFDALVIGFCLPYLTKEEAIQLIAKAATKLNPGALLYLSTMEDDYDKSKISTSSDGKFNLKMYFHEKEYLIETLKVNGFEILECINQDFVVDGTVQANDLILIAKKSIHL